MSEPKFEAQMELSCMQSIQWYPIAKGYWELSQKRSDVGFEIHTREFNYFSSQHKQDL